MIQDFDSGFEGIANLGTENGKITFKITFIYNNSLLL